MLQFWYNSYTNLLKTMYGQVKLSHLLDSVCNSTLIRQKNNFCTVPIIFKLWYEKFKRNQILLQRYNNKNIFYNQWIIIQTHSSICFAQVVLRKKEIRINIRWRWIFTNFSSLLFKIEKKIHNQNLKKLGDWFCKI